MNGGTAADEDRGRIEAIDAVRGFAVCGILIMNVVAMAMPVYAYADPTYYGGATGWNLAAWAFAYIFADGKMRALFTLLFGASTLLIADRAEGRAPGPAQTHYRRMAWLFVFGMIHAWGFWYGDILVEYAVCGGLIFLARKWPTGAILFTAGLFLLIALALDLAQWQALAALKAAATGAHPPAAATTAWNALLADASPRSPEVAREISLYRGGIADVFAARAPTTRLFQTSLLPASLPETLGYALAGMALLRAGFLNGAWPRRYYAWLVAIGLGVAVPLHLPVAWLLVARHFDPPAIPLAEALGFVLRPWIALAYASAIILLATSGRARAPVVRLAAAGRMAFSNYLGTTLVATTLFYGYGFGLFGRLDRAQLWFVIIAIWLLILGWSKPWLDRFAYGPLEWLWRSLARGARQSFRRISY